jgi:glutamate dehydrogenase/leucine dehydrogenase
VVCADALNEAKMLDLGGARVIIQGFGVVGWQAARLLAERGRGDHRRLRQPGRHLESRQA